MSTPVVIGCKLPNGIIINTKSGKSATLKGANSSHVIGGYGLTTVAPDLWEEWYAEYQTSTLVKSKMIFAQTSMAKAEGQAREQSGVKSNYEPLKTDADKSGAPMTRQ